MCSLLSTAPDALDDGPNCLPALFMTNLCRTAPQNQAVCFDQPLDREDYEHFRANVAFNISRMFESRLKGIAQHKSFQALIVSTLVEMGFHGLFPTRLCDQQRPCPHHCTD